MLLAKVGKKIMWESIIDCFTQPDAFGELHTTDVFNNAHLVVKEDIHPQVQPVLIGLFLGWFDCFDERYALPSRFVAVDSEIGRHPND
jgi:hypothetical protein